MNHKMTLIHPSRGVILRLLHRIRYQLRLRRAQDIHFGQLDPFRHLYRHLRDTQGRDSSLKVVDILNVFLRRAPSFRFRSNSPFPYMKYPLSDPRRES